MIDANLTVMSERPLCVDLDHTLCRTDTLVEAFFLLIKRKPLAFFAVLLWLAQGKIVLKKKLYRASGLDPKNLPFNLHLLSYLQEAKAAGRRLVLVTASDYDFAVKINNYLKIFDDVIGSKDFNCKGEMKARCLIERYGLSGYDYIGDHISDIPVWKSAYYSVVVGNRTKRLTRLASPEVKLIALPEQNIKSILKLIIKQIRVHQWAKNALIFLPMILSHRYGEAHMWFTSILASISFASLSSIVYIINDILDLESDRKHPENSHRPFASGQLSQAWSLLLIPVLLFSSISMAVYLGDYFFAVLFGYFFITTIYSVKLKRLPIADIIVLAILYSWRVLAGSVATKIDLSHWFLTFSIFFFFSLALLKRCSELHLLEATTGVNNNRRGYELNDLNLLQTFGIAAGYISILILALYLADPIVIGQMNTPILLWLLPPVMLYWISRMWMASHRGKIPADPLIFALKDNVSYLILLIISLIWLFSKGF